MYLIIGFYTPNKSLYDTISDKCLFSFAPILHPVRVLQIQRVIRSNVSQSLHKQGTPLMFENILQVDNNEISGIDLPINPNWAM